MEDDETKPQKCDAKLKFKTKAEAGGAKIYTLHQHGVKLKVYFCKDCGWWHLSSA